MTAAERRAMCLGFLEIVVAEWWDIAVDFQFEDVHFFEKSIQTRITPCGTDFVLHATSPKKPTNL